MQSQKKSLYLPALIKIKQMKDNDLCTVIGNLIDNAIEAELRE